MALEQVAEREIVAEHVEALVASQPLEPGRRDAAIHARGQRAAPEAVAAEVVAGKPAAIARAWTICATVCGVIAALPMRGRAGGSPDGAPLAAARRQPDAAEHQTLRDTGRLLPAFQRLHRTALATGTSVSAVAKQYGTSRQTVMRVRDAA
jgi:hypothetical protein